MTEVYPHPMPPCSRRALPRTRSGIRPAGSTTAWSTSTTACSPPGEVGELVYRPRLPDSMAREYYKDPEATMTAFRNFMFHTGDLGYHDEEGRLHYAGRRQDRIRRRGENVSAAELEFIALGHADVLEAAAFGVPGELGEHEIKLDVVAARAASSTSPVPRLARGAPAALHGPALHRAAGVVPEDAQRAHREVQADDGGRRTSGGARVRSRAPPAGVRVGYLLDANHREPGGAPPSPAQVADSMDALIEEARARRARGLPLGERAGPPPAHSSAASPAPSSCSRCSRARPSGWRSGRSPSWARSCTR